jgi:hypothetical protein
MKIDDKTKDILKSFHNIGGRITGSLARGEFKADWSDIDIQIPESKWDLAKQIMRDSGLQWIDKGIGGSVGTKQTSTMIDVSYMFDKTPKEARLEVVIIEGIKFLTW